MKRTADKIFFSALIQGLCLLLVCPMTMQAQRSADWINKDRRFIAWPIGWIAPETGIAAGAAMTYNFRPIQSDSVSPVSQISAGFVYTTKSQSILSVPFALYLKDRKHTLTGEFSYNDFSYDFYGIGPGNFKGLKEDFEISFSLFRINYLYRFNPHIFGGMRWWFQHDRIDSFSTETMLDTNFTGRAGGSSSGPGLIFLYDSRDNIYYPSRGLYAELTGMIHHKKTGSDFDSRRYRLDLRYFLPLHREILAGQLFMDRMDGNPSFTQMPGIGFGNGKRGRGYYEGRYRDRTLLLLQAEWRHQFHEQWASAVFGNYSFLADEFSHLNWHDSHAAAGLGLRYFFDKKNRTTIRLDLAWPLAEGSDIYTPGQTMKLYFAVNEVF